MGSFVLLVVFAAFFVLFADELTTFFKKAFGVPWIRLLVPLIVISLFWVWYDEFFILVLAWIQTDFEWLVSQCAGIFPATLQWVAGVGGLYLLASIPAWAVYWRVSRQMVTKGKVRRVAHLYLFVWIFFVLLYLM